jgi:hypothetical protein
VTPRAAIIGWLALLCLVFGAAVWGTGCSKQLPPCPVPTAAWSPGYCFSAVRNGREVLFCAKDRSLCQYAYARATVFAGALDIDAMSECKVADVALTVKAEAKE